MPINTFIWLAGIHSTSFLKQLPNHLFLIIATTLSFIYLYHLKKNKWIAFLTIFLLGFTLSIFNAKSYLTFELPKNIENKPVLAVGYIASAPEKSPQKTKFYFQLIKLSGRPADALIQLTWHRKASLSLKAGEKKQLLVKLKRPHSLLNPGGFDQEKFYFRQKIRATGYVLKSTNNKNLNGYLISQLPNLFRQWLYEKMAIMVPHHNLMGVIIALCLGIANYITPKQWDIFQATGTTHLISISGLHIGLAAGFFYFLTQWFWRIKINWIYLIPIQQAGILGGLIGAFIYSLLAGFSIPTQRSLIMISVLMLSTLCRRNMSHFHSFSLAIFLATVIDPLATLSESFWLSFGAVFFIFYVNAYRISFGKSLWNRMGKIQWAVTLGLIPITFLFFQQTSIVSLPANLIAIPWVSFLVTPLALTGMALTPICEYLARWTLFFSNKLLEWVFIFLEFLGQKDYARWYQGIQNWQFIIICLGILLMLTPKGIPSRWLGILTFIPFLFYSSPILKEETIGFTLLDVGQGLSAVVRTQHHTLVFDTGVRFSERFDMGKAVIIPYLRQQGIKKIDTLIVSHKDNDHMGGAQSILEAFPVHQVLTSVPQFFPKNRTEPCHRWQNWTWDGVEFRMLYPILGTTYEGNNSSCTLEIKIGNYSILITGDLEKSGEAALLQLEGNHLASTTILIAGHHGSKTSSSWPFIKQINPRYVLFSAGYMNQYRHPNHLIVDRYRYQGSFMENTAQTGGLYFELNRQIGIIKKIRYREMLKKYWHHRPY